MENDIGPPIERTNELTYDDLVCKAEINFQYPETYIWLKSELLFFSDPPTKCLKVRFISSEYNDIIIEDSFNNTQLFKELLLVDTPNRPFYFIFNTPSDAQDFYMKLNSTNYGSKITKEESHNKVPKDMDSDDTLPLPLSYMLQQHDIAKKQHDFSVVFDSRNIDPYKLPKGLQYYNVRSILWRIYLGILPEESIFQWKDLTSIYRESYDQNKRKYLKSLNFITPEVSKTEDDIRKDISRTNSKIPFFNNQHIQDLMIRILIVIHHTKFSSYQQGMCDLLSIIILLLYIERYEVEYNDPEEIDNQVPDGTYNTSKFTYEQRRKCEKLLYKTYDDEVNVANMKCLESCGLDIETDVLFTLQNPDYIEHDSYMILSKILDKLEFIFPSEDNLNHWEQLSHYIQHDLLRAIDPDLERYLQGHNIDELQYLLPWYRLIFIRQFSIYDTYIIWDKIFSISANNFQLMDYISVFIAVIKKDELLRTDLDGIQKLFKNPEVNVQELLSRAIEAYNKFSPQYKRPNY